MKMSVEIDAELVEEVVRLSGGKSKAEAVKAALREYVRLRRKELLLRLPSNIRLEENWQELRDLET